MQRDSRYVAFLLTLTTAVALRPETAPAAIARFETSEGLVDIRLYNTATPITVANFLAYVNANSWDDSFIHRSIPGFVVQGGGYKLNPDIFTTIDIPSFDPIQNEYGISNIRGTIAMAKLPANVPGGGPDSATNEWFFNIANNSANLDNQNGGFTVFGRVISGLGVVDSIAALDRVNVGGAFDNLPVLDVDKVVNQGNVLEEDSVILYDVYLLDFPDADYTFDHKVTGSDYLRWQRSLGLTTNAVSDGDGSGVVDAGDLALWQNGYGVPATQAVVSNVPEPAGIALAAGMGLMFVTIRRRERQRRETANRRSAVLRSRPAISFGRI